MGAPESPAAQLKKERAPGSGASEGQRPAAEGGGSGGEAVRAAVPHKGSVWGGVVAVLCAVAFLFCLGAFTYSLLEPGVYFDNGSGSNHGKDGGESAPLLVCEVASRGDLETLVRAHPEGVALAVVAKWCGHCRRLAPEWEAAASLLEEDASTKIVLARLEATASDEAEALAEELGVEGFPSVRLFHKGDPGVAEEYEGPTDQAVHLAAELRGLFSPAVAPLSSVIPAGTEEPALDAARRVSAQSGGKPVVMALLDPGTRADGYRDEFEAQARRLRKLGRCAAFLLGEAAHGDVVAVVRHDPAGRNAQEEEDLFKFGGSLALADFLNDRIFPEVVLLTKEGPPWATELFVSPSTRRLVAVVEDGDDETSDAATLLKMAAKAAPPPEGRYRTFLVPAKGFESAAKFLGYTPGTGPLPWVVIHEGNLLRGQGRRFAYSDVADEVTLPGLSAWLAAHASGALNESLRSEPAPPASDASLPVRKAVASTARALVGGDGGPGAAVVLVHAPGCPHCEAIAPLYAQLGRALEGEPRVTLYTLDGIANDLPDALEGLVEGFPTIVIFPAGGRPPEPYPWNPGKVRCMLDWVVSTCGIAGEGGGEPLNLRLWDPSLPACTDEDKDLDGVDEDEDDYFDYDYEAAGADSPPWDEL